MMLHFFFIIIAESIDGLVICSYGEEKGWRCREKDAEYVWVLDPIDGTKSFITGKFIPCLPKFFILGLSSIKFCTSESTLFNCFRKTCLWNSHRPAT